MRASYSVNLVRRESIAEATMAFYFSRPAAFSFKAGQSVRIRLIAPQETDSGGDSRIFSIASAPHETDLMIATRMRDTAYKRTLTAMPLGTTLELIGPSGDMVLENSSRQPLVFLAGGIGITPFLSMVRHASHSRLEQNILLFYGNRRPEDAPFLNELGKMGRHNPHFRFIALVSEPENSARPWKGETGMIRRALIEQHVPDLKAAIYYFAGPPAMTEAVHKMLEELGIAAQAMRSEKFTGY